MDVHFFSVDGATATVRQSAQYGCVWVDIENGSDRVTISMPQHPDMLEAAEAMAMAFNSLAKPALKEAA